MPATKFPKIPTVLTYANWSSKKAKLTPETGMGKELKKLEASFEKIKVRNIDSLLESGGPETLRTNIATAEGQMTAIEATRKVLFEISRFAKARAAEAKKKILFPKASIALLEQIAKEASEFATSIRDTPERMLKEAQEKIADYDVRLAKRKEVTTTAHSKLLKHHKDSKVVEAKVQSACKTALISVKGGNVAEGKKQVHTATLELDKLAKLKKACEVDSATWRTFKSGGVDKKDAEKLIPLANEIMTFNKEVGISFKACESLVQKTFDAVAKA